MSLFGNIRCRPNKLALLALAAYLVLLPARGIHAAPMAEPLAGSLAGSLERENPRVALLSLFPYYYRDLNGEPAGFSYEAIELLFGATGFSFDHSAMPVGRIVRQMGSGIQDIAILYRLPKLLPEMDFFATLGCQQVVLVPIRGSNIARFEDVAGKKIAYLAGGRFDRMFVSKLDIIGMPFTNAYNIFAKAVLGNADAVVFNRIAYESSRRFDTRLSGVSAETLAAFDAPIPIVEIEVSLAISRKSKFRHIMPAMEAFAKSQAGKSKLEQLFAKYGSSTGGACSAKKDEKLSP